MMLFAFFLLASLGDWVPMRWPSGDPKSLDLLAGTPMNCVLVERGSWSSDFAKAAAVRNLTALAVVRPGADAAESARRAHNMGFAGIVLEGTFENAPKLDGTLIEIGPRRKMRLDGKAGVAATDQGVWPGIQVEEGGATKAAPSGGPWIDTNTGFLRFVRASTVAPVWIANLPPANQVIPVERYFQAIGDAAMVGARWVLAFDDDFNRRLLAREPRAMKDWQRIAAHLKFYEDHRDWRSLRPYGELALVQDPAHGGLISGGILDMIAVKHTPVRAVPLPQLSDEAMKGSKMAVNVDPTLLNDEQKETLRRFARSGGTLLTGPPGWQFPSAKGDAITLEKQDLDKLDTIWKELNSMTGRRNLGARLFNVSSMLSNLSADPAGKRVVLHLVNYSNYPAEDITIHVLGSYKKARMYLPESDPKDLAPYAIEEGTAIEVQRIPTVAAIVLE